MKPTPPGLLGLKLLREATAKCRIDHVHIRSTLAWLPLSITDAPSETMREKLRALDRAMMGINWRPLE